VEPMGKSLDASLVALRGRLSGDVLTKADPGYDEARTIWNAMIEARPALIALPESDQDVAELVRFAVREDIPFSVRGGGRNIAGTALVDGGLTINMSRMRNVTYLPDTNRVVVQAGAIWADVDVALELYGLIVPGGIV